MHVYIYICNSTTCRAELASAHSQCKGRCTNNSYLPLKFSSHFLESSMHFSYNYSTQEKEDMIGSRSYSFNSKGHTYKYINIYISSRTFQKMKNYKLKILTEAIFVIKIIVIMTRKFYN